MPSHAVKQQLMDDMQIGWEVFPAHTVAGGFSHSYCPGQVHTVERYGKIVSQCVLENFKVGS